MRVRIIAITIAASLCLVCGIKLNAQEKNSNINTIIVSDSTLNRLPAQSRQALQPQSLKDYLKDRSGDSSPDPIGCGITSECEPEDPIGCGVNSECDKEMSRFFVVDINDQSKARILHVDWVQYFAKDDATRSRLLASGFDSTINNKAYNARLNFDKLKAAKLKSLTLSEISESTENFYKNSKQ